MSNVISLKPNSNIPEALRNIAAGIERGEIEGQDCTLVIGSEVFHLGCVNDEVAAVNAVFNMTFAIQKLIQPGVDASLAT